MPENSIHSILRETFPKANKEIWKRAASQEIDGKDPFDILSWKNDDGINFFPYYDHEDLHRLQYLNKFHFPVGENSFSGPRQWFCTPNVSVTDEIAANQIALKHLQDGADGVLFNLNSSFDLFKLLSTIEWTYCALFFKSSDIEFQNKLADYIRKNKYDANSLTGALLWDAIPKKGALDFFLENTKKFKAVGLIVNPSSPSKEIAEALTKGVEAIENLKSNELSVSTIISSIAFSISINTNFFESIAKLKALRLLWFQVAHAYGVKNFKLSDLHIHAHSNAWISNGFAPQSNMIKSTTAGMASILGGCDSLTISSEDENNSTMNRVARNVSAILREESHLDKVADPISGSYTIDNMVDEISKKAWSIFQSDMK